MVKSKASRAAVAERSAKMKPKRAVDEEGEEEHMESGRVTKSSDEGREIAARAGSRRGNRKTRMAVEDMPLKRFRLLKVAGAHAGESDPGSEPGVVVPADIYSRGDVVESPWDLDKMFENKFQRLPDEESAEVKAANKKKAKTEEADEDEEDSAGNKIYPHTKAENRKVKGTTFARNPADHVTGFNTSDLKNKSSNLGENVTDQFPNAAEADVIVLEDEDGEYSVATAENPHTAMRGASGLSKSEVNSHLKKLLKGEEED